MTFRETNLLLRAAIDGLGVALSRRILAQPKLDSGHLVRPVPHSVRVERAYFIIYPNDFDPSQRLLTFRDRLLQEARSTLGVRPALCLYIQSALGDGIDRFRLFHRGIGFVVVAIAVVIDRLHHLRGLSQLRHGNTRNGSYGIHETLLGARGCAILPLASPLRLQPGRRDHVTSAMVTLRLRSRPECYASTSSLCCSAPTRSASDFGLGGWRGAFRPSRSEGGRSSAGNRVFTGATEPIPLIGRS
jgi:hypothetical protein